MKLNLGKNQKNQAKEKKEVALPEKKIDIKKYEDISADEIPMKKLSFGLWWVKNRQNLKTILIVFLTIISAVSWGYTLYNFGYYILFGMREDERMLKELVQTRTISSEELLRRGPRDLSLSPAGILESDKKYDLYARVMNPNQKHWGIFSYCFTLGGAEIECGENFIFPEEEKYILVLSKESDKRPTAVRFKVGNVSWRRINLHEIPDWEKFRNDRLTIDIKNISFTPANASGLSEKLNLNILNFKVDNNTAFSYWEVPLTILLFRGNKIVGVNKHIMKEFVSNDQQEIKITWPGIISGVTEIKVIPNINIMDKGVYMNP